METKISATFFIPSYSTEGKIIKNKGCKQVINITKKSYDYMTSDNFPSFSSKKEWSTLSKNMRIIKHLSRTMEYLGATKFDFQVFTD
jgi:hypothetical protein